MKNCLYCIFLGADAMEAPKRETCYRSAFNGINAQQKQQGRRHRKNPHTHTPHTQHLHTPRHKHIHEHTQGMQNELHKTEKNSRI